MVFLENDRTLEFYAPAGSYYKTRIPKVCCCVLLCGRGWRVMEGGDVGVWISPPANAACCLFVQPAVSLRRQIFLVCVLGDLFFVCLDWVLRVTDGALCGWLSADGARYGVSLVVVRLVCGGVVARHLPHEPRTRPVHGVLQNLR